ncbi:hypothetical protein LOTGIDRAFT_175586 [Lottia gigantea]|uniref:Uncharacterized protein n=1 Tax=Lottia gigantea TaxID=225164 RepID=V4A8V1_LOTGI|nr:hypothetical protein LOTGIDRAFT_175586 [Lottia gigantea]ESO93187.1 hypothetical protein LOTGIDRAFT_175586 [Lottia gigantea]
MWKWIAVIFCIIIYTQCVKFGEDNSYTCHCINDEQCHRGSGICGGGCARGWSGPTCQKQNVALGKPSSQVETNGNRTSDLAVDGDRTTNIPAKCSDTSSGDSTRWWRVDLLEEYPIKHITIYYQNKLLSSLNGFSLHVVKENETPELCYKDDSTGGYPPAVHNVECSQVITGRYVNISNFHTREDGRFFVVLCSNGTFGSNCTNFCHCLNKERCLENGKCPGECADGWAGTTCNQKCEDDVYGVGCSKKCSDRKCKDNNLQCDSKTGECIDGCQPGYQSIDCTQDKCSYIDGACDCFDGYLGVDCTCKQANTGNIDQTSTIIGTLILGLIIGFVAGSLVVLFLMKRSNISNNQDKPYGQLTTAYQHENAYELLRKAEGNVSTK